MAKKSKHSKPFIYDFVSVYTYIKETKEGHSDVPPETYDKLKEFMPGEVEKLEKKSVEQLDDLIQWQPHTDTAPTSENDVKKEEKGKRKQFGTVVKNLIFSPSLVTDNDIKSLLIHIKKRVYNQFIKLRDEKGVYANFDCTEIAQTVFTAIYAPDGFFNYFKATNPEPEKVTIERCWQKFSHRVDEIINRLYKKFMLNVFKGIRDSSAIKDVYGHHDLGLVREDGKMARDKIEHMVPIAATEEEDGEDLRARFEPDEDENEEE